MRTITKERISGIGSGEKCYTHDDVVELARIALASLEAEAVGTFRKGPCGYSPSFHEDAVPLYTAHPAPVSVPDEHIPCDLENEWGMVDEFNKKSHLPDEKVKGDDFELDGPLSCYQAGKIDGWNEYRAAMLQGAEPVTTAYKLRDAVDAIRNSGIAIDAEKIFAERDALNSPVIPDGLRLALSNAGIAAPESDEMLAATCEKYIQELVTWVKDRKPFQPAAPDFREIVNSSTNNCRENAETSTNCPCCGRKPLKNKTCSVAGCDGKHVARGFCAMHYAIERKKDPSRRESIRAADKRYRARKSAAPQQEVK